MKLSKAFTDTLSKFELTGAVLAGTADVSVSLISRFRGGKPIRTDGLEKILKSLDDQAFSYLLEQIASSRGFHVVPHEPPSISELVEDLDQDETAALLFAIAKKVRQDNKPESQKKELALPLRG
ncbi:MAG: hypothetical protein AAFR58_21670 [Cyanobacteria bacterium J06627_28]